MNYEIEKDLLKETYASNLESINIVITIVLGIFGLFGFLGIRDINRTKQDYLEELAELRNIKSEFERKSSDFDTKKEEIDDDLRKIIQENQQQSQKIKFIELKEKVATLFKEKKYPTALEFVNTALEIQPDDIVCLTFKGQLLVRHNQFDEARKVFRKAYETDSSDIATCANYVEILYFCGELGEADKLIQSREKELAKKMQGRFLEFLALIKNYYDGDIDALKSAARSYVEYSNLDTKFELRGWNFDDAMTFSHHLEDSEAKSTLRKVLGYWKGLATGRQLLYALKIELPKKPDEGEDDPE